MALKTKRCSLVTSSAEGVDQLETVDPSITEIRHGSQAPTAVAGEARHDLAHQASENRVF